MPDLAKELKQLQKEVSQSVRDLNRINQRTHDEIIKLQKEVKSNTDRDSAAIRELNKINQRAYDEIKRLQTRVKTLEKTR